MCYHCNFKNKDRIHLGVQLFQGESRNSFVNLDMTKEGDNYYINVDLERYDQEFRYGIMFCPFCGRQLDE